MEKTLPTFKEMSEALRYEPEEGAFYWVADAARNVKAGRKAGTKESNGYISIRFKGKSYKAHRTAWLFTHKEWPKLSIDHINGQKNDNRISNLREATTAQNGQNRKPNKESKTGFKGVRPYAKKFKAEINHQGKYFYLGLFSTAQEAANAYAEAAARLHTHNNAKRGTK